MEAFSAIEKAAAEQTQEGSCLRSDTVVKQAFPDKSVRQAYFFLCKKPKHFCEN